MNSSEAIQELLKNRPALIGFLLSVLQLLGHSAWILLIWYLDATGQARSLDSNSWISWGLVGLFGISLVLTFVSLFVCLYYGLRRSPRSLAVIGFSLSFFVGTLATTLLIMTGLRAMSRG